MCEIKYILCIITVKEKRTQMYCSSHVGNISPLKLDDTMLAFL